MILIVRYILETCSRVSEAVSALLRIPVAQSQNVLVLDKTGAHATVLLGPERDPAVSYAPVCANHQESNAASAVSSYHAHSMSRQHAALRIGMVSIDGAEFYDELDVTTEEGQARRQASSDFVR